MYEFTLHYQTTSLSTLTGSGSLGSQAKIFHSTCYEPLVGNSGGSTKDLVCTKLLPQTLYSKRDGKKKCAHEREKWKQKKRQSLQDIIHYKLGIWERFS